MRYYDLNQSGKVEASYAVPQPGLTLHLLDEPPDKTPWMRDGAPGENWIPDQEAIDVIAAGQARIERKRADLAAELPAWATLRDEMAVLIDAMQAATTVTQLRKATVDWAQYIKGKMKILYWVAKDTDD